jgi:ADP-heptose:LPS heptosyltransferase
MKLRTGAGEFSVNKTGAARPVCDTEAGVRRLLIRPGAIGDFILSLPALEGLRGNYTEVWTASPNVPLARFADRARSIASMGLDLLGIAEPEPRLIDELRGFDSIVSWYGSNREDFGECVRALGLPVTFFPALPRDSTAHAADFYLDQARTLAPCLSDGIPRIDCAAARENFAVIQPFSSNRRKDWPLEHFRRIAVALERRMPVHWCRGAEDPPLDGAATMDDLWELACWLARASLYIGNDSGITHLAAAVGTPTLAIFGPTDPQVWAPRGPNVRICHFYADALK